MCGDVWTIGRNKSEAARRITQQAGTHSPEQAVLFTCPQCDEPLGFESVVVQHDHATVTFTCADHGYFTFADDNQLIPATHGVAVSGTP